MLSDDELETFRVKNYLYFDEKNPTQMIGIIIS